MPGGSTASVSTLEDMDNNSNSDPLPYVLARHSSHDCYFDIKIIQAELATFHGRPAYQLHFKLDFARPFEASKRIRSAVVNVDVSAQKSDPGRRGPTISAIDPEASLVYIADHEIASGQNVGVNLGAPGPAAGAISVSAGLSWGDKTTFKGSRLIHGFLPASNKAQWKMYEERKSKSGLPPSVRLMMIVETDTSFHVSADVLVQRWSGWGPFGAVKSLRSSTTVETPQVYLVRRKRAPYTSESALMVSDNVTKVLKESEERMQILESIIDSNFPQLNLKAVYGPGIAILVLRPLNQLFDRKQLLVPFHALCRLGRADEQFRATDTNGLFDAAAVSDPHAAVRADEKTGSVYIEDHMSTGGIFVNGQQLAAGQSLELHKGDELQLGTDILDDDGASIKHPKLLARVEFAGLLSRVSSEDALDLGMLAIPQNAGQFGASHILRARKEAVRKDVDNKFEIWKLMMADEEQEDMLTTLEALVDRRIEALDLNVFASLDSPRPMMLIERKRISTPPAFLRESSPSSFQSPHAPSDDSAGTETPRPPSERIPTPPAPRPPRESSPSSFHSPHFVQDDSSPIVIEERRAPSLPAPRAYVEEERVIRDRPYVEQRAIHRERAPEIYIRRQNHTIRRTREGGAPNLLVPKVPTAEEALANHRAVGRDWQEAKL
ncbi:hypothetical protein A1O3_03144 [Capronia epimyces CBS 606.96]|uniref:FHA domain-containing protein n=1 Tax=Capronia epimyces CBS 606.96 TaxID=1182542 RepID=W9YK64_9EURO|nr:uncharacterized protein A1O3_03144 [Capronia epimyces CBS 606.96]EXJ90075.1 hypothetical protein A1O3_03144 [Capronia epimyces CBS 606.96]